MKRINGLFTLLLFVGLFFLMVGGGYSKQTRISDNVSLQASASKIGPELQKAIDSGATGTISVNIILKDQPLHEVSVDVKEKHEREVEASKSRIKRITGEARKRTKEDKKIKTLSSEDEKKINIYEALTDAEKEEIEKENVRLKSIKKQAIKETIDSTKALIKPQQTEIKNAIEDLGGKVTYEGLFVNIVSAEVPVESLSEITSQSNVGLVEKSQIYYPLLDTATNSTYAPTFWAGGYNGSGIAIAIVDTGVNASHPAISSRVADAKTFVTTGVDSTTYDDLNGHGTHVAGIAASTDSTYKGVAFGASIINAKAGNVSGSLKSSAIMNAIDWAIYNATGGADIISASFGGPASGYSSFERFFDAVVDLGLFVSVAAGNSGSNNGTIESPGISYNVMTVGAIDDKNTVTRTDDTIASYSSRGPITGSDRIKPDIVAPGSGITSLSNSGSGFVPYSGTSMATPHVSGAAALLMSAGVTDPREVKALLINTAEDLGSVGANNESGWGYLDLNETFYHLSDVRLATINSSIMTLYFRGYALSGDKATIAWNKHQTYDGPAGNYSFGTAKTSADLDLYFYSETSGAQISNSTRRYSNVEQVQSNINDTTVVKVTVYSFGTGLNSETFALATEEGFTQTSLPEIIANITQLNTSYTNNTFQIEVNATNNGSIAIHNVNVTLSLSAGVSLASGTNPAQLSSISGGSAKTKTFTLIAATPGNKTINATVNSSSYGEVISTSSSINITVNPALTVHNLNKGTNYSTIQAAIDDANANDTITVDVGTYNENIDINKSINLVGDGADVTIINTLNSSDHVIEITADWVNVSGFTVTGAPGSDGIFLNGVDKCNISNNKASNNHFGIYLDSSNYIILRNNTATLNNNSGIHLFSSSENTLTYNTVGSNLGYGIVLESSNNNTLINNTANNNGKHGIILSSSSLNNLSNNNANSNNYSGIFLQSSSNYNILADNTINSNNYFGIWLWDSSSFNNIANNTATSNNDSGFYLEDSSNYNNVTSNFADSNGRWGIYARSVNNNTLTNNNVSYNGIGIYFDASNYNTLTNNVANSNINGILFEKSHNNSIFHNNFINNTNQSYDDGNNTWDNGYPSGGNYWSSWTSPDFNADGVVDYPYPISGGNNTDRYPVTSPNGWLNITPDTQAPVVTIVSPENKSYTTRSVPLNFTTDEIATWQFYVDGLLYVIYDGTGVQRLGGPANRQYNKTLDEPEGVHNVTINATDIFGNSNISVVYFAIDLNNSETQNGTNVTNTFIDNDVNITFDDVTSAGVTTVIKSSSNPGGGLPTNYKVAGQFYNITTTANYTGNVTICINGFDIKPGYKMFHWTGAGWKDITTTVNDTADYICGATDSLSPFSVFYYEAPTQTSSGGGGGSGGGSSGTGGGGVVSTIFEGREVLTEEDLIDIMVFLGHDFGPKFAFGRFMSPLTSIYAAKDRVVMSLELANRLLDKVNLADLGLERWEMGNIYEENADYILQHYPGGDTLIIARGDLGYDSLTASPLSDITGAPTLLVEPGEIPEPALKVMKRRQYRKIYVIGGEEAVSADIEEELKGYTKEVVRLGGETRYETSVEVTKEVIAQGGNRLPLATSGKDPVLYTATLANKYRSPIIYIDRPPVHESTFKAHDTVEGSLALESFDTYQAIGDKSPKYTMNLHIKSKDIKDAWMYVRTIGYDSVAEKWTVKLNVYPLAYKIHSEPVATHKRSQLLRFDVGKYIKEGENELLIEGTNFNIDDQYYIIGVTFVILYDSDEKTEYWINENGAASFGDGSFGTVKDARLYALHLDGDKKGQLELNDIPVDARIVNATMLRDATKFSILEEADVSEAVQKENSLSGDVPALSILAVTSDEITVPPEKIKKKVDSHQRFVKSYLDQEKFDQVGMIYYKDSIPSD